MKKTLLIICMLSTLTVTSCAVSEKSSKEITSVEIKTTESITKNIEVESNTDTPADDETITEEETETKTEPPTLETKLEEQLLWEFDNIKVYAKGIESDEFSSEIKLLVENNSDKDVVIYSDRVAINDYMITDLCSITCTAGNKNIDSVHILNSFLEESKIECINKIDMSFHARDNSSFEEIASSDPVTIYTSDYDENAPAPVFDGTTLVDQNNVKILGLGISEDEFLGPQIVLYIENNTDQTITVYSDDIAVNGFMTTGIMSAEVSPGKKRIDHITLLDSKLEENGITSVDTVELKFRARDEKFDTLFETDKITFSAK